MLGIIMQREMTTLARSKAMRISTAVIVLLILIVGLVARFLLNDDDATPESMSVGYEQQMSGYAPIIAALPMSISATEVTASEAEEWLRAESEKDGVTAVVLRGEPGAPELLQNGGDSSNYAIRAVLSQVATMWVVDDATGGITAAQAAQLGAAQLLPSQQLEGSGDLMSENPAEYFSSIIILALLVMAVTMGVSVIATGVVEEKSSRVVEILLSTVRPRTLLLGKILGIGIVILAQFLIFVAAIVAAVAIAGISFEFNLGTTIAWSLAWVVVGFFLYASLTGALAATVSRQEDLGAVTGPVTIFLLVAMYAGMFLVPLQPDSTLTKILSMIPFFSSFMMPVRQLYGVASTGEQLVALALALVTIPLIAALAGKIYENSILRTGKRVSLISAIRGN